MPKAGILALQTVCISSSERVHLKLRSLRTILILLVPILLVAAPVLWSGTRSEIAHWYLAAAANAVELGKGDPEESIESARAWEPEVERLADYWTVRIRQLAKSPEKLSSLNLKQVPPELKAEVSSKLAHDLARIGMFQQAAEALRELLGESAKKVVFYWDLLISDAYLESGASQALELIREAIESNPNDDTMRYALSAQYANIFSENEEFDAALDAYKIQFGDDYARDRITLNTLAYSRALALRELDAALVDIDEALTYAPQDASMRDTRAWVLYQLGRYEDALKDADFAVKEFEKPTLTNWLQGQLSQAAAQSTNATPATTEGKAKSPSEDKKEEKDDEVAAEKQSDSEIESSTEATRLDNLLNQEATKHGGAHRYATVAATDPLTWTRGVIHYHRAKILEKLGRSDEAKVDWDYLEQHNLPPDDRLH